MAIQDYKITSSDLANKGVVGLPDTPNLSTLVMQEKFDEIAKDIIVPKHNGLIEFLGESLAPIVSENPVDGETFIYNSTDGTYKNGEYRTYLKRLKDVDITNIQNGDFLNYDGNRDLFVPIHSSGTVETITACEDVSVLNPKEGDFFVMGANNAWENREIHIGLPPRLIITSETGAVFTATKDTTIIDLTEKGTTGVFTCDLNDYGTWIVTGVKNGETVSVSISVDTSKEYTQTLTFFAATIAVTYPDGATVTCSDGTTTLTATASPYDFIVHNSGTWTITGTRSSVTETQTVSITTNGQTESVTLTIVPDGDTATPTADIQTLLECADIWDKTTYTTISDLLDDDASLLKVLTTDNAIDYLVRSTTWTTAITGDSDAMAMINAYDYCADTLLRDSVWSVAICNSTYSSVILHTSTPTMTSDTMPYGECVSSSVLYAGYERYRAFDKVASTGWQPSAAAIGQWIGFDFKIPMFVKKVTERDYGSTYGRSKIQIIASDDGTNWDVISSNNVTGGSNNTINIYDTTVSKRYWAIKDNVGGSNNWEVHELDFYGRMDGGVQTWLRSGGITDKSYTTLAEVLADTTTLSALIASHDAVDYLVTAKAFIDGIVADATAMSYIGLNNYCANSLIADSEWLTAIANSTYVETVLNVKVPTMTSDTTPSGTCSADRTNSGSAAYRAFDGDASTYWTAGQSVEHYIRYAFTSAVKCYVAKVTTPAYTQTFSIRGDGTDTLHSSVTQSASTTEVYVLNTNQSYSSYELYITASGNGWCTIHEIQFYGREDV